MTKSLHFVSWGVVPSLFGFMCALALAVPVAAQAVPVCGDNVVDPHEDCDDGNQLPGDGCSSCQVECASDAECPLASPVCDTAHFPNGVCILPCTIHYDCPQGEYCYYGKCLIDAKMAIYHCGKPGCIPGRWCIDQNGQKGSCAEDPNYECEDACDCGPAHACLEVSCPEVGGQGKRCVKDVEDPWLPGGTALCDAAVPQGVPTYCCADPACEAGMTAYCSQDPECQFGDPVPDFYCYSDDATEVRQYCGGPPCYTSCDCEPGESCIDRRVRPDPHPGQLCNTEGGFCTSNAVAEAVYDWASSQLLPCCASCTDGQLCEAGWSPGGVFAAERVVAECPNCGDGSCDTGEYPHTCQNDCGCGDGVCAPSEVRSCVADCGQCGDGSCDDVETPKTCPSDCLIMCGDGSCDAAEPDTCPEDCLCSDSASFTDHPSVCGDGVCDTAVGSPENCDTCSVDCGVIDTDGDGTPDCEDPCPLDVANDADGDGLCESDDNCAAVPNPNQSDLDGDGEGDACDPDIDGDGVPNADDNCVFDGNASQRDTDGDGAGDACDTDLDGDGVLDANDACVPSPLGDVVNADGCAIADLCPCEHPDDATKWKNHGAYVKCVAHTTEDFVNAGLITDAEKDEVVSEAASSACGHKK